MEALTELASHNIKFVLHGPTALDRYFHQPAAEYQFVRADADVVTLATIFDDVTFPGVDGVEAAIRSNERWIWFVDDDMAKDPLMAFCYDPERDAFCDPGGVYRSLRELSNAQQATLPSNSNPAIVAVMCARYGFRIPEDIPVSNSPWNNQLFQMVLNLVLTGEEVEAGLAVLDRTGVLEKHLGELGSMKETGHSKEGHPEGDVWRHTMETFRYRKDRDYLVAVALLLHDVGKPSAQENNGLRFDRHADIGARVARRMLNRIGTPPETVESVWWLVRNHMIPGALDRLPPHRRNPVMSSPLFPRLLELYRCDLSSTYRGPEGYYRACRVYRKYLRDNANPFRDAAGKKLVRAYVE